MDDTPDKSSFIASLDAFNHSAMLSDSCDDQDDGPKTIGAAVVIEHQPQAPQPPQTQPQTQQLQSPVEAMDTQEGFFAHTAYIFHNITAFLFGTKSRRRHSSPNPNPSESPRNQDVKRLKSGFFTVSLSHFLFINCCSFFSVYLLDTSSSVKSIRSSLSV